MISCVATEFAGNAGDAALGFPLRERPRGRRVAPIVV